MKALIKKINFKLLIIITSLVLFEAVVFFITKPFVQNPYVLGSTLDAKIPFVPQFIWIYIFWYLMLILVPYYIAKKNPPSFYKYAITFAITTVLCGIIFVVFPNTVTRANIQESDIASKLVQIIYTLDNPAINCFPSIHCLFSYLFIFAALDSKENIPLYIKVIIIVLSILVVLSTLFIKQHVVYDAIGSLIIGSIVWLIVNKFKLYDLLNKILK